MWGFKRNRVNTQNQSNKAKAGSIKNSTIEVMGNSNDATQAIILKELLNLREDFNKVTKKFDKRIDKVEETQHIYMLGFNHYVQNNGVKPKVKKEVEDILNLKN